MKVLRAPLGRPINRLYFKAEVLDERCERKIADFMERHGDGFRLHIPTSTKARLPSRSRRPMQEPVDWFLSLPVLALF